MQWHTTTSSAQTASRNFFMNPIFLFVMEGAPSVARPCNFSGLSSKFFTNIITYTQTSCPIGVEERLAMSNNSSILSKSTVTAMMNINMLSMGYVTYVYAFIQGQTDGPLSPLVPWLAPWFLSSAGSGFESRGRSAPLGLQINCT